MLKKLKKCLRQKLIRSQKSAATWIKVTLAIIFIALCGITLLSDYDYSLHSGDIKCFHALGNVLEELRDQEPAKGSSIFFHETTCRKNLSEIWLSGRQACSIESALKTFPDKDVFLLISSPVMSPLVNSKNELIHTLLKYPNFKVRHIPFSKYLANTPMASLDEANVLYSSNWPVSHASDILRYATLYKFGGIYLDLDVIMMKALNHHPNFAGAESGDTVTSSLLGFGWDEIGREVSKDCAEEIASTFDGKKWGFNGPGVITRVLKRRCNTSSTEMMSRAMCKGFDVFPVESFFAIPYDSAESLFVEDNDGKVARKLKNSYAIHFWNKLSFEYNVKDKRNIPFVNYARTYCPYVSKTVQEQF